MKKESILSSISQILTENPYGLEKRQREDICLKHYLDLSRYHYSNCENYRKIIDFLGIKISEIKNIDSLPFIPVRLFKEFDLISAPPNEIVKTITSSGTSGQSVSKIFLDRETAVNQSKVLARIAGNMFGNNRRPMLVIDSSAVIKDRKLFSARGAGILGFSMLGHGVEYALDENMELRVDAVNSFLKKYEGQEILLFGFTFMVWKYLYVPLNDLDLRLPFEGSILVHGGGWKKLQAESVSNLDFKKALNKQFGIKKIVNYYGMVEQTGSIFMECEFGRLHSSIYSDIIIRRHSDFSSCEVGEEGIVQTLSVLPTSYPGHSILTEDIGRLLGEDDCLCGRKGRYFEISGRVAEAEVRGCSDTYAHAP